MGVDVSWWLRLMNSKNESPLTRAYAAGMVKALALRSTLPDVARGTVAAFPGPTIDDRRDAAFLRSLGIEP